jgi:hypothetical protein
MMPACDDEDKDDAAPPPGSSLLAALVAAERIDDVCEVGRTGHGKTVESWSKTVYC